jgi:diguanylate cyclase (GGDEF)-like protein
MEFLENSVSAAGRRETPLTYLMIDIDHFKKVNDTYGHPAGDAVLREVGHAIRRVVRDVDLAGRYGGEEFAVVAPETNVRGVVVLAQRLRTVIEGLDIRVGPETTIKVTASIGVAALNPAWEQPVGQLIAAADGALYEAKNAGRNTVRIAMGGRVAACGSGLGTRDSIMLRRSRIGRFVVARAPRCYSALGAARGSKGVPSATPAPRPQTGSGSFRIRRMAAQDASAFGDRITGSSSQVRPRRRNAAFAATARRQPRGFTPGRIVRPPASGLPGPTLDRGRRRGRGRRTQGPGGSGERPVRWWIRRRTGTGRRYGRGAVG